MEKNRNPFFFKSATFIVLLPRANSRLLGRICGPATRKLRRFFHRRILKGAMFVYLFPPPKNSSFVVVDLEGRLSHRWFPPRYFKTLNRVDSGTLKDTWSVKNNQTFFGLFCLTPIGYLDVLWLLILSQYSESVGNFCFRPCLSRGMHDL